MSTTLESFPYPSLPSGVDAIRILSVEPGDFSEPLVCKLIPVAFSDQPQYTALSYTWRDPYPDNAALPTSPEEPKESYQPLETTKTPSKSRADTSSKDHTEIPLSDQVPAETSSRDWAKAPSVFPAGNEVSTMTLNNWPFPLHHNLYLAILHLRSPTHSLALWADAVCINQADTEERNAQVAMMSFIYTRALKVVAWLGVREYSNHGGLFHSMYVEWKAGQVRLFGASLANAAKMRYSLEPDQRTAARIAVNPYWTRLWVVQETCLARVLVFVYGSKIWKYEDLVQWEMLKAVRSKPLRTEIDEEVEDNRVGAILQLVYARNTKYTDTMRLESLIERFAKNKCSEVMDRVYGLLGLANDAHPLSSVDDQTDPTEEYLCSLDLRLESPAEPKRGRGIFKIDYSRPLYDIWTDVVKFVFFRAKNIDGWCSNDALNAASGLGLNALLKLERRISVVRTAGIVQAALDQKVEEEVVKLALSKESVIDSEYQRQESNIIKQICEKPVIRAQGYLSGKIVQLGPRYTSFVGSFRAQQDWLYCWEDFYHKPVDLETLRRINESYMAEIVRYKEKDLARVREIRNPNTVAWRIAAGVNPPRSDHRYATEYDKMWNDNEQGQPSEPRLFLGTDSLIGLIPSAAKIGDFIIQFWNCNAAIVVRPINLGIGAVSTVDGSNTSFMLVGRANVAEVIDRKANPGFDMRAEERFLGNTARGLKEGFETSGAVYVDMDFPTLQIITAFIAT
jgi:hypothetical protein